MRAEPSISPLTLGLCCAVVAGALALAPAQVTSPVTAGRGADVVALEGEAMNRDQPIAAIDDGPGPDGVDSVVDVAGRMTSGTESPPGDGVAIPCTVDCGGVQPPTVVQTGTAADEAASDGRAGGDPADRGASADTDAPGADAPAATATGGSTDGTGTATADGSDTPDGTTAADDTDLDSCRSPRAVAARSDGPTDVAPPSPCSHHYDQDPCRGPDCDGGRSSGTTEA